MQVNCCHSLSWSSRGLYKGVQIRQLQKDFKILCCIAKQEQVEMKEMELLECWLHNVSYKLGIRLTRGKTLKTWPHGTS